jgi:hypothetical protein
MIIDSSGVIWKKVIRVKEEKQQQMVKVAALEIAPLTMIIIQYPV